MNSKYLNNSYYLFNIYFAAKPLENLIFEEYVKENVQEYLDKTFKGLHLDSIFLYSLFSSTFMSVRLRENLLKILVDYFNQRSTLLSELIETEILDTEEELKVYNELDGVEKVQKEVNGGAEIPLVSVKRLRALIEKFKDCNELVEYLSTVEPNKNTNEQLDSQNKKKSEKMKDIILILDLLLKKFKEMKQNPYIFLKTQNILRNLQYHEELFKVLRSLHPKEDQDFELIVKILKFFEYFSQINSINQQQIIQNSPIFFQLLDYRIPINRLFTSALDYTKSSNKAFDLINDLFELLEEGSENQIFKDRQVLSMLQSLLTDRSKVFNAKIQKKILAKLLKNKRIMKFTQTAKKKNYSEIKNALLSKLQTSKEPSKVMDKIYFHLSLMTLFGNLCRDFKMGVQQMQKVLVYEQIKNLLLDVNTPFLFKKAFLKTVFQIYMVQMEGGVNANFTTNDIAEYLNLLVLPDLNVHTKYLEGIVDPNPENEECRRIRERIIESRSYYQCSLDAGNEDKPQTGANLSSSINSGNNGNVSILKKAVNNANQTGLVFDSKKIIEDPCEYWEYLFGGKTWDNSRDGLLYFLLDCFYESERRRLITLETNDSLTDAFSLIKSTLVRMKATLQKLEKDFSLDFSNYYLMILEGISQLPTKIVTKAGKALKIQNDTKGNYKLEKINVKEEQDQKMIDEEQNVALGKEPSDILLDRIRSYLIKRRMKIQEFLDLFEVKLELVPKGQFLENFQAILEDGQPVKANDIASLIEKWGVAKVDTKFVRFLKFCDKMRRFFIKKKFNYEDEERGEKKEINLEETEISFKKDKSLTSFIKCYYNKSLTIDRNNEIAALAIKFKRNLEDITSDFQEEEMRKKGYSDNLKKLLTVFRSETSEVIIFQNVLIYLT